MFTSVDFWLKVIPLLSFGFLFQIIGLSNKVLLAYLTVISFYVIADISLFSCYILIAFVLYSMIVEKLHVNLLVGAILKLSFLILIKLLYATELLYMLPFGISFIVFQAISYSVDKRNVAITKSNTVFVSYLIMFPQVFAGPIIKYQQFADQIKNLFRFNIDNFMHGSMMISLGIVYKEFLSARVKPHSDLLFSNLSSADLFTLYGSGVLFGIQIYADFAAYSLLALGLCRIVGFTFPDNFFFPYVSSSLGVFWQRWHISLGRFLHSYLYLPLQNQLGFGRSISVLIVFVLSGIWHGVGLNYVAWGFYNGAGLVVERYFGAFKNKIIGWFFTLNFVCIGWILFRIEDLNDLFLVMPTLTTDHNIFSLLLLNICILVVLDISNYYILHRRVVSPYLVLPVLLSVALGGILVGSESVEFIYFQF